MSNAEYTFFPSEIVEKILFYVDGKTFARASLVCKQWNDVVLKYNNKWQQCCETEIENRIVEELLSKYHCNDKIYSKTIFFHVYKNWVIWKKIQNNQIKYTMKKLSEDPEETEDYADSSVYFKIHGNYTFVRKLSSFNLDFYTEALLPDRFTQQFSILDLPQNFYPENEFIDYIIFVALLDSKLLFAEYNTESDKFEYSVSFASFNAYLLKTYKNKVVIANRDTVTIFEVFEDRAVKWLASARTFISGRILDIFVSANNVFSITDNGTILKLGIPVVQSIVPVQVEYILHLSPNTRFDKINIFRDDFIVGVTSEQFLFLAIKHEIFYFDCMEIFEAYPTVFCLYLNIFIVGLSSGAICLYFIKTLNELADCIQNCNTRINVSKEPIHYIDISENKKGPIIAVVAGDNIYYIHLI